MRIKRERIGRQRKSASQECQKPEVLITNPALIFPLPPPMLPLTHCILSQLEKGRGGKLWIKETRELSVGWRIAQSQLEIQTTGAN